MVTVQGPSASIIPGSNHTFTWEVPPTDGPIVQVGFELNNPGKLYLDTLTWDGTPNVVFTRPKNSNLSGPGPHIWRDAWANGIDYWQVKGDSFRIVQNEGRGLICTGRVNGRIIVFGLK